MVAHSRRKSKGTNAERELVKLLWEKGWAALRTASSGSMKVPLPDVVAARKGKLLAIECKTTKKLPKYLNIEEVKELEKFADVAGALPIIAVKVSHKGWIFVHSKHARKTSHFVVVDGEEENIEII